MILLHLSMSNEVYQAGKFLIKPFSQYNILFEKEIMFFFFYYLPKGRTKCLKNLGVRKIKFEERIGENICELYYSLNFDQ
jgi:hypothetical protein